MNIKHAMQEIPKYILQNLAELSCNTTGHADR